MKDLNIRDVNIKDEIININYIIEDEIINKKNIK